MEQLKQINDKYGFFVVKTAFQTLLELGYGNLTEESVIDIKNDIEQSKTFLPKESEYAVLDCAIELQTVPFWTLISGAKKLKLV